MFFHLDPPGPPSQPEIIDSSFNYIKFQWKKPLNDGGNPVKGYLIECREILSTEWIQCNNFPTKHTEYMANNVLEGFTYEFRVKAVNDAGPGNASKPSNTQKAEPLISIPSPVDQPKIEEISKESVSLSWRKPIIDGGSKVIGYIIEKKSINGLWEEIIEVPAKDTQVTIKNVQESEECQFRIKAKNAAGLSDPSKPSQVIKIEEQPLKPMFDISHLKDITVKSGQNYEIHVPFKAHPIPTADWTINDKEILPETGRVEMKVNLSNLFNCLFSYFWVIRSKLHSSLMSICH